MRINYKIHKRRKPKNYCSCRFLNPLLWRTIILLKYNEKYSWIELFVEIKIPGDCISKLIPKKSCRERKFLEFMEEYSLTTTYLPHSHLLIQWQPLVTNIIKTSETKTRGLMIPLMESWNNVFIIQMILSKVLIGIKVMALLQIQSLTAYRQQSPQAQQKKDFLPPKKCSAHLQLDSVFGIQNGCFALISF